MVQWLGLHISTTGGKGSIPAWGTKITQAVQPGQKIKKQHKIKTNETNKTKTKSPQKPLKILGFVGLEFGR